MRIPAYRWAWLLACAIVVCACTPRRPHPHEEAFSAFLGRIPRLSTPANVPLNWAVPAPTTPSSVQDSAFYPEGTAILGYVTRPDGHVDIFHAAIGTDYTLPVLRVWRDGVKVEEHQLGLGGCGSGDCGFECSEEMILNAPGDYQSKVDMRARWCLDGMPTDSIMGEETRIRSLKADGNGRMQVGEE